MAILPLGTGNDLARVLGWGVSAAEVSLPQLLERIQGASITMLDRWEINVYPGAGREKKSEMG